MQAPRGRVGSVEMPITKLNRETMLLESVPELGCGPFLAASGRSEGGQRAVSGRSTGACFLGLWKTKGYQPDNEHHFL